MDPDVISLTLNCVPTDNTISNILTIDTGSGQVYITTGSAFGGGGGGGATFPYTGSAIISGSLTVTGSLNVTEGITGSLQGTASYASQALSASNASTASYLPPGTYNITASWANNVASSSYPFRVSGSTIYSAIATIPTSFNQSHSIFIGSSAGDSATNASQSVFLGRDAGISATNAYNSNFFGYQAGKGASSTTNNSNFFGASAGNAATKAGSSNFFGPSAGLSADQAASSNFFGPEAGSTATNANNSNFFGAKAGDSATNAKSSNFFGAAAGQSATNASQSNFIGTGAGTGATNAETSNFIGFNAGQNAVSASYSTLLGYQAGYAPSTADSIWSHNIIIGTNISLPAQTSRQLNIGGVLFGSGLYNTTTGNPYTGSQVGAGRIGINVVSPSYTLDVNGTSRFNGDSIITGSMTVTGNFTVLGSASIQNITSSQLNIGTNIVTVNTNTPSIRFGGYAVADSGSSPIRSGSLLFDSTNDQWIFVHQATAAQLTSSVLIMGPQTFNNLGNETNLTNNRIPKSTLAEHIGDSNITDTGTYVSINSVTQVTGSLTVSGGITGSLQSLKAGSGSVASFGGSPLTSSVTFTTPFANNLYAITMTGEDARTWTVQSKVSGSFVINSNSTVALTGPVYWIATPFNS